MQESFYGWGLPIGRIAGIRVRLHWLLLIFWVSELTDFLHNPGISRPFAFSLWLVVVGSTFLCILLHELGHCFAARRVGGEATEILLWPLGGLAMVSAPNVWRAQLVVAAGGPLANALVVAVAWAFFGLVGTDLAPRSWWRHLAVAEDAFKRLNLYLLVFNLVPLYPLDGGRIFHSILWGWFAGRQRDRSHGYLKASVATVWATRVCAILGLAWAVRRESWMLGIIMVWAWSAAEQFLRGVHAGAWQEDSFGHDDSRGYRSLESTPRVARRAGGIRSLLARILPRTRRAPSPEEESRRLDEILAKIGREGMTSLSKAERAFLEDLSRRRRGDA